MEYSVSPETAEQRALEVDGRLEFFNSSLKNSPESAGLVALWMGLKSDLWSAIEREKEHGFDHGDALVLQFADAFMNNEDDVKVIDSFFASFGSSVEIDDGRGNKVDVPVTTRNFRAILNSSSSDISLSDGSMVLPTSIKGVSIKVDGSAVTSFDTSPTRSIRPMLLVSTK